MNLLIVDDEIYAIQGIMDDVNWDRFAFENVISANSCAQAMRILEKNPVEIVICDIEMPSGTGLDLMNWIRQQEWGKNVECILLTCHPDFKYAQQAIQLDCMEYLLKPAPTELLNRTLTKAVERVNRRKSDLQIHEFGRAYLDQMVEKKNGEADENGGPGDGGEIDTVSQVEQYVREHIGEVLTVEELAQMNYVSPAHLSRLFRKKYRIGLNEYIIREKMTLAKSLLDNPQNSVSMVSSSVGYTNYSYFTKTFRKAYGLTPSEYKRQVSGE